MSPPEAALGGSRGRLVAWSTVAAVGVGVLLRTVLLDADPQYYAWIGYITDEGRWLETARSLALFGHPADYGFDIQFWVAPLFALAHVPLFALFGVNFWTARLLSSLAGGALLLWLAFRLRGRVSPPALFLGVAVLAAQPDLVMLSRVATPETAVMLMQAVVLVVLAVGIDDRRKIVLAAVLTVVALAVKFTLLPMVLAFTLTVIVLPRTGNRPDTLRARLVDGAIFAGVIAGAATLAIAGALAAGQTAWLDPLTKMPRFHSPLGSKGLYVLLSYPFEAALSPTLNTFALAAWLGALAWWTPAPARVGPVPQRLFVGALLWSFGWYVPMSLLGYFPHRYHVHLLVPFALMAVFAADALGAIGVDRFRESLVGLRKGVRAVAAFATAVPAGAILAPVILVAAAAVGVDPARLRSRLAAVAVAVAMLGLAAWARPRARTLWTALLVYPFVFAGCWAVASTLGLAGGFWPSPDGPSLGTTWPIAAGAAVAVCAVGALAARSRAVTVRTAAPVLFGWALLIASVGALAPGYLRPTYTMRDASRELGRMLDGSEPVTSILSDSLFLENDLPFRAQYRFADRSGMGEHVLFFDDQLQRGKLRRAVYTSYAEVKTFHIRISPAYRARYPKRDGTLDPFVSVALSRLVEEPADAPPEASTADGGRP